MPETTFAQKPTPYATCADFQRIFKEDMNSLYTLAFLLTADDAKAEQCFVSGLDEAVDGNPVFKEWARSWARRVIIQNAIRTLNPRPAGEGNPANSVSVSGNHETTSLQRRTEIAAVLRLDPFDRFIYLMSVLERHSEQDCALLLGCTRRDVIASRARALQQMAQATERREEPASPKRHGSLFQLLAATPLATPA